MGLAALTKNCARLQAGFLVSSWLASRLLAGWLLGWLASLVGHSALGFAEFAWLAGLFLEGVLVLSALLDRGLVHCSPTRSTLGRGRRINELINK